MSSTPDPRDWDDEQIDALLARLEERVDTDTELGQAVKSRRRDVLKAIGAVGAGGLAGAAGMDAATGEAAAGSQQAGTLGSPGNPVDAVAEDIYGPGGQGSGDPVAFEAVQTPTIIDDEDGTAYDVGDDLAGGGGGGGSGAVSLPQATLGDGQSITLRRFTAPSSTTMEIFVAGVAQVDGTTSGNLTLYVENFSDGTTPFSTTTQRNTASPISSFSVGGDDIEIGVSNQTGGSLDVTAELGFNIS